LIYPRKELENEIKRVKLEKLSWESWNFIREARKKVFLALDISIFD
jgi:hypothetical protein